MNIQNSTTLYVIIILTLITNFAFGQQTPLERSVLLSAEVQNNPAQITLNWESDPSALYYRIYRKRVEEQSWNTPIASLSANELTFIDTDVVVGQAYEYAVFKKEFERVNDTLCVPAGTELKFSVSDMYGIGLCCSFGFGDYKVEACDSIYASGDDFGWGEETIFTICDNGNGCEELIISLQPDLFPNSTSWTLQNNQTGEVIGRSGDVGAFIDLRPAYGHILSGIEVPAIHQRGTLLLLIEDRLENPLIAEILRLELDLIADGWKVTRRLVNAQDNVASVKDVIQSVYQERSDLEALFILGHVPVPYSGDIYPDTHTEHRGAWAADTYYGELTGDWTDSIANRNTAFFAYNHNVPGDGKFDQDSIPTDMELQVGRVDFFNMPAFSDNDIELTRKYLQKNHLFRNGGILVQRRGLIDDNFNTSFGGPAASGWRNFSIMFGPDNIDELDYMSTLKNESYLWSYGCGPGTHISSAGVGSTDELAADSILTVFNMFFGSQFGDWDNVNNFLRAPLGSGLTLTNCWAGNPAWSFHHMALGYHIGHSIKLTQNSDDGIYQNGPQMIHTALMGDPSLRMHVVRPVDVLLSEATGQSVELTWPQSSEFPIEGYHVYRAATLYSEFERLTNDPITSTSFTDSNPLDSNNVYMVRVQKLEESASGNYLNLSQGRVDSIIFERTTPVYTIEENKLQIYPNPTEYKIQLQFDRAPSTLSNWQIYTISGQLVKSAHDVVLENNTEIDLSELPNGIYNFSLQNNAFEYHQKIILQRK